MCRPLILYLWWNGYPGDVYLEFPHFNQHGKPKWFCTFATRSGKTGRGLRLWDDRTPATPDWEPEQHVPLCAPEWRAFSYRSHVFLLWVREAVSVGCMEGDQVLARVLNTPYPTSRAPKKVSWVATFLPCHLKWASEVACLQKGMGWRRRRTHMTAHKQSVDGFITAQSGQLSGRQRTECAWCSPEHMTMTIHQGINFQHLYFLEIVAIIQQLQRIESISKINQANNSSNIQ